MQPSQPIPRLTTTEARILEAFLNPETTFLAIAASLKLSVQELLDALASPAIRAALDALSHLDAIRRRLSLAPIVPGALTALRRLLDQNDKPAEVRRAATTILNTYTRLERTHARQVSSPYSPLGGVGRLGRPVGAFSTPAFPTGSTGQSAPDAASPHSPLGGVERRSREAGAPSTSASPTGSTGPSPALSGQPPVANRQSPDRRPSAPSADSSSRHRVAALAAAAGLPIRAGPAP